MSSGQTKPPHKRLAHEAGGKRTDPPLFGVTASTSRRPAVPALIRNQRGVEENRGASGGATKKSRQRRGSLRAKHEILAKRQKSRDPGERLRAIKTLGIGRKRLAAIMGAAGHQKPRAARGQRKPGIFMTAAKHFGSR